jgi:O-antigen ligase
MAAPMSILSRFVQFGLLAIVILAPSQFSIRMFSAHVSPVDPLIWFTLALWGVSLLRSERPVASLVSRCPPPENLFFLFLCALSICKAQSAFESVKELIQIAEYVLAAYVLFAFGPLEGITDIRRLTRLFIAVGGIVVAIGCAQYFMPSIEPFYVRSTFGNRNSYGGFLAIFLPLVLSLLLFEARSRIEKILLGSILVGGFVTVLSAASLFGILIGGLVVSALHSRQAGFGWIGAVLLFCLLLPYTPRRNAEILAESIRIYDEQVQVEPRYTEWQSSVSMWRENPILGVGIGNYQRNIGMYYGFLPLPEGPKEHDNNNLFLVIASSTGILGLAGLVLLLASWLGTCLRFRDMSGSSFRSSLGFGAAGGIVAFSINSIWSSLMIRGVFLCVVIVVAMAHSPHAMEKRSNDE